MSESRPSSIIGMAALARCLIAGDNTAVWDGLSQRYQADVSDADALFDMAMLMRLTGKIDESQTLQSAALRLRSCFTCRHARGEALQVLVLVTGADVMANAPIDFLCEDAEVTLHFLHLDAAAPIEIPPHDVTFVAIGQSEANRPLLEPLVGVMRTWQGPVMNGAPERVLAMTRDATCEMFRDCPGVLAPANLKVQRAVVEALADGRDPGGIRGDFVYPMLIRPPDTHGGKGLERIEDAAGWRGYLDRYADEAFFLASFIDYSNAQGWFPKLRITFIDGRPYATHMAVSDHWLAHYISAGMLESAEKRALEAAWMADFDQDFAVRHSGALAAIAERFGVDYFSIDCAETPDGRLLLFEADVASIVHALDPIAVFPYKRAAMDTLFTAFVGALRRRAQSAGEDQAAA
jgi:hypothetical protein